MSLVLLFNPSFNVREVSVGECIVGNSLIKPELNQSSFLCRELVGISNMKIKIEASSLIKGIVDEKSELVLNVNQSSLI